VAEGEFLIKMENSIFMTCGRNSALATKDLNVIQSLVLRPGFEPGSAAFPPSGERPSYMVHFMFNLTILPEQLKIRFL